MASSHVRDKVTCFRQRIGSPAYLSPFLTQPDPAQKYRLQLILYVLALMTKNKNPKMNNTENKEPLLSHITFNINEIINLPVN